MVVTKTKTRAHSFEDGGGIVTGTHDVAIARDVMLAHIHEEFCGDSTPAGVCIECDWVTEIEPEVECGRFIPRPGEGGWWWRSGYELGKPGVTRAVKWSI